MPIQKFNTAEILRNRKIVLLVDLDETLIHSTFNRNQGPIPGIQLVDFRDYRCWLRLRPGAKTFLRNLSTMYELVVCTRGEAGYAKKVVQVLDPTNELFKGRIISREHFAYKNSKSCVMTQLFDDGDSSLICMIDDTESMWQDCKSALIPVPKYIYFKNKRTQIVSPTDVKEDKDCCLQEVEKTLTEIHSQFYKSPMRTHLPNIIRKVKQKRGATCRVELGTMLYIIVGVFLVIVVIFSTMQRDHPDTL